MNTKHTIFLVEDDFIYLEMLHESLKNNPDYMIHTFQSGEECLEHLHLNPDIIILDHILNNQDRNAKNGIEILTLIKQVMPNVRFIIVSSQEDANVLYSYLRLNISNYIPKDLNAFENVKTTLDEIILRDSAVLMQSI